MKAATCNSYGPPEKTVQIADVEKPIPNPREVLIRVHAASVNPLDVGSLRGRPYLVRMLTGLKRPKFTRPGVDVAGQVEAVGRDVTRFLPGDEVFGVCITDPNASGFAVWNHHQGAFAEYVCAPEATLVLKPENVSFEVAASVPLAAFTALQGLRDKAQLRPGQRVLINGASGGVGALAVQIAKAFGAEVTGVCSAANVEMVRSIGADRVVDYSQEDFTLGGPQYDVIFDCVGNRPLLASTRVLKRKGVYLMVGDLSGRGVMHLLVRMTAALMMTRLMDRRFIPFLARPNQHDLIAMRDLLTAGTLTPFIDRRYTLSEVPEALLYVEQKHARGKVVVVL